MPQFSDFSLPLYFSLLTLVMFLVVAGRYFLIASIFQIVFFVVGKNRWTNRRLGKKKLEKKQFYTEVKWSLVTSLIFALAGAFTMVLWQKGYTRIYIDVHNYPLWYLPVSLAISMAIHESYYYWLHR